MKRSKRMRAILEKVDTTKEYSLREAIKILKEVACAKFDETVEVAFHMGLDPRRSDQMVRGSVVLPHGTGKTKRVLVLTKSAVDEAKQAGADYVGSDEYIEKIQKGWLEFDAVVATPEVMKDVAKLGRILGPRGLMPSPKTGTVTNQPAEVIRELKKGRVDFKLSRTGDIHVPVGKISFTEDALYENILELVQALLDAKPAGVKGTYIQSMHISSTMGPGLKINLRELFNELQARR